MKINLLILCLILTSNFVSGQYKDFELPHLDHVTKLKIKRDGFTIKLDGKKGNLWASNPTNAKIIAEEIIRIYKLVGGKERVRVSNLSAEIEIHAKLNIAGKFVGGSMKEINTVWSDLTIRYSKYNIVENMYQKLKHKLKWKVTQKDIAGMIK